MDKEERERYEMWLTVMDHLAKADTLLEKAIDEVNYARSSLIYRKVGGVSYAAGLGWALGDMADARGVITRELSRALAEIETLDERG